MTNNNSDLEKDLFNLKNNLDDDTSYSPFNSLAYFVILSVIYTIIMVANINSQSSIENISVAENNKIYLLIYIFLLFGGYNYINTKVYQSYCKGVVDSTTTFNIFSMTLIPWVVIFGSIYFLLELFPGWVDPFANTIGYFLISFIGLKDILKELSPQNSKNPSIIKALENINSNQSMFLNEIDSDYDEFKKYIKLSVNEGLFENTSNYGNKDISHDEIDKNSQFIKLYALIKSKFFIGKIIWFILAGLIISSISYNFVINLSCNKNTAIESALIKNIYENDKPKFDGKKWKVYNSQDKENHPELFESDITQMIKNKFNGGLAIISNNKDTTDNTVVKIPQYKFYTALSPGENFEVSEGEYVQIEQEFFIPIY
tara:strand:+ start:2138 stop:3253 length:1116 start_codon:yes stop_codon:yes gene_type:complete